MMVKVDGGFNLLDSSRLCLGARSNAKQSQFTENIGTKIGKGFVIQNGQTGTTVHIHAVTTSEHFIFSLYL